MNSGNTEKLDPEILAVWAQSDPEAVATWLGALPAGDVRMLGTANLTGVLVRQDPSAAEDYVATLPEGSARSQMAHYAMAAELATHAPERAFEHVDAIGDPGLQAEFYIEYPAAVVRFAPERVPALLETGSPKVVEALRREVAWQDFLRQE